MIFKGKTNEYLQIVEIQCNNGLVTREPLESPLTFLWFQEDQQIINIDNVDYTTKKNQIFCLTEFHKVNIQEICNAKMICFNRSFYCILDHDNQVGCKGILFFGASQLPIIDIRDQDLEKFQTIWKMFELEMEDHDDLQLEMLQSMLKRFIILCTRVYKAQQNYSPLNNTKVDLIREFNFLVEQHFRTIHTVAEYAAMLHKSPKTLSNLFSKVADKSPLQYIHHRKMLEAKRLLGYTNKSVKEIAYEIGFEDVQTFGRFFKKMEGMSPTDFKEKTNPKST